MSTYVVEDLSSVDDEDMSTFDDVDIPPYATDDEEDGGLDGVL